ncbi:MAG: hypothetical protein ACN6P8_06765, partial [Achromobacter piechaudii]
MLSGRFVFFGAFGLRGRSALSVELLVRTACPRFGAGASAIYLLPFPAMTLTFNGRAFVALLAVTAL